MHWLVRVQRHHCFKYKAALSHRDLDYLQQCKSCVLAPKYTIASAYSDIEGMFKISSPL